MLNLLFTFVFKQALNIATEITKMAKNIWEETGMQWQDSKAQYNPFNQQKMYISFKKCKIVVFWTKNPKPILPYLHELDERGIYYYFQVTLNDYVKEGLEPNVSSVEDRVETFKKLSDMIGKEKVIWRFDPLIITPNITPRDLLTRIWHIGNKLKGYTNKLVFSFVDVKDYRKVQSNLIKETMFLQKRMWEMPKSTLLNA